MIAIGFLLVRMLRDCFKSRRRLEAEILVLRHQLNVLRQRAPRRLHLRWADRAVFIWLYRRFPRILDAITIVRPETVVRWHRMGFAAYWRWKSRRRPRIGKEVRDLIQRMSLENPLWGAPRIHGELLKLGIDVGQTSVAKYMARHRRPPKTIFAPFRAARSAMARPIPRLPPDMKIVLPARLICGETMERPAPTPRTRRIMVTAVAANAPAMIAPQHTAVPISSCVDIKL